MSGAGQRGRTGFLMALSRRSCSIDGHVRLPAIASLTGAADCCHGTEIEGPTRCRSYIHSGRDYQPNRAASSGRPIRIDRKCGGSYHHVSQSAATYRAYRLAVRECETINRTENCMKAQHRRELHTNLLADRMGRLVRNVQSAPKSTSIILWSFVVLAAGTFIIWEYAARS